MDKAQKQLVQTYYRKRNIAAQQGRGQYKFQPYEYSKYALDNNLIDFNKLPIGELYEIYKENSEVREYVKPAIDNYNKNARGLMRLVLDFKKSGDSEDLFEFIASSDFYTNARENYSGHGMEITSRAIYLNVDKEDLLLELDLDDDYSIISATANSSAANMYPADKEEANYMYSYLDNINRGLIRDIATLLGYPNNKINDFTEEGELMEFLEKYGLEEIYENYLEYFGDEEERSRKEAAEKQMESIPIDIDDTTIYIDRLLSYLYEHGLNNLQSFDEFLNFVEKNNDISHDRIYDDAHEYTNYDDLNYEMKFDLENIIDEIENNPDNEYYNYAKEFNDLKKLLTKLGFEYPNKFGILALKKQDDKEIRIKDTKFEEDDFKVLIHLKYKDGKSREGWVVPEKIKNYVNQREIPGLNQ